MKLVTILDANLNQIQNPVMHALAAGALPTVTAIPESSYFYNTDIHRPVIAVGPGSNTYKNFLLDGDTATSCTTIPTLSGDVTNTGNAVYIGNNKVTNAMILTGVQLTKLDTSGSTLGGLLYATGTTPAVHTNIKILTNDLTFSGAGKITSLLDPVAAQDAATKNYVDNQVSGITDLHAPCQAIQGASTIANLASFNKSALDYGAYTLALNSRVLILNQTNPVQNGIYYVSTYSDPTVTLTRATDADGSGELRIGSTVLIQYGTQAGAKYTVISSDGNPILPGTNTINWVQSTTPYVAVTAGNGLTGTTSFAVLANGTSIDVSSSGIRINTGWLGQSSITTLGTITTGVWNGTEIAAIKGGTGLTDPFTGNANKVLGVNNGATAYELKSILGTIDQITVTHGTGTVTLSIPSSFAGTASIATVGTITSGTWSGTTIAVNKGGTGLTSYTANNLLYASGATTIAGLANNSTATIKFLTQISNGSPTWTDLFGTSNTWGAGQVFDNGALALDGVPGYIDAIQLLRSGTNASGCASSHRILMQGQAYDGSTLRYANWYLQNRITSNVAASSFIFSSKTYTGAVTQRFEFSDTGLITGTDNSTVSPALRYTRTWSVALTTSITNRDNTTSTLGTSTAVKHMLANAAPIVVVYDSSTKAMVLCDVTYTDTNTVTLGFSTLPASGAYTVVITG